MRVVSALLAVVLMTVGAMAEGMRNKSRIAAPVQLPWEVPATPAGVKFHNFEAGVFLGWGLGEADQDCKYCPSSFDFEGLTWGGYVGYMARPNEQLAYGGELDLMRLQGEQAIADWLMSLRGRIGYYVMPNVMGYGTAGMALEPESMDVGVVVGGGVEYNATKNTSIRLEYLHYQFDSNGVADLSQDVVKASFGWKF